MFRKSDLERDLRSVWDDNNLSKSVGFSIILDDPDQVVRWSIMQDSKVPKGENAIIFFRNHPIARHRVLQITSRNDPDSYNATINARRKDIPYDQDTKMAIYYEKKMTKFKNVSGNIYLYWACSVTSGAAGGVNSGFKQNIPLIVHTDGQLNITHIVLVGYHEDPVVLAYNDKIKLKWNLNNQLFLDKDPDESDEARPNTLLSAQEAEEQVLVENQSADYFIDDGTGNGGEALLFGDEDESSDEVLREIENEYRAEMEEYKSGPLITTSDSEIPDEGVKDHIHFAGPVDRDSPQQTPRYVVTEVTASDSDNTHSNILDTDYDDADLEELK